MRRLLRFLGVQAGEGRSALLMVAHAFCMGTSTVFFETAASALFLSQFEGGTLPWVYLAAALVNILTGALYSWIKERASFERLMTGTLLFLFVSACLFRLGLLASPAAWLSFAALVFYRVLSLLTDLEYWAVAARLYDVRQAKRLFGLIGTGEVVARIAGAFSVPLAVRTIGVANLIWVSAAGLLACLVLVVPVLRLIPEQEPVKGDVKRGRGTLRQIQEVSRDRYLVLVTGIAVLAVLGKHFVDFAFLEQMRTRFSDASRLAGFFGIFSGLTQGLSLLTRLLSGRLLQRFGIRVGLLVLPLAQLACTLLIALDGVLGDSSESALVFWLVIANQGIYKTLKHPIDNPSFKVLYQPLRADRRLRAQIVVEAVFTPIALGVAGGIMLLMSTAVRYDPVRFAYVLLLNFTLWALLARLGSRAYQGALMDVLRRRLVEDAPFAFGDATSVALLRARLDGKDEAEVLFALHLLEKAEYPKIGEALVERLEHPAPGVRRYALERLLARADASALDAVRRRVEREPDAGALAAGLRALAALGGPAQAETLERNLGHADAGVRRAALGSLLGLAQGDAQGATLRRLAQLAASAETGDRLLAAQALAEHCPAAAEPALRALLNDGDPGVRRSALLAAAGSTSSLPLLVENLGHPAFAAAASRALVAGGESVVEPLCQRFAGGGPRVLLGRLLRVLGEIGGARGIAFLRAQLDYPDLSVRNEAISGLLRCRFQAKDDAERAQLLALLRQEAGDAAFALGAWHDLEPREPWLPLREALATELTLLRERCFSLLSFVYEREAVLRARDNVHSAARHKRAYAVEVLDVTLDGPLKGILLPLLDDRPPEARLPALQAHFPQPRRAPAERVRELLSRPERSLRGWTRACAAQAAGRAGLRELVGELAALRADDPLLRQAAAAAIARIEEKTGEEAAMLLIEKVMILKGVQIFAETAEEILTEIAAAVEEVEFKAGERIFQKGDAGDSMYVIVEGRVRVFDDGRTINELGEREIFGELALLDPEPRSASCAALSDARLFRLDAETFSQLMAGNIEIVRGVLHVLCSRLRRVTSFAPAPR